MCPHLGSPEKLSGQLGSNPSTWIVSPALPQASYSQQPAPFTTRRSPTTLRDGESRNVVRGRTHGGVTVLSGDRRSFLA